MRERCGTCTFFKRSKSDGVRNSFIDIGLCKGTKPPIMVMSSDKACEFYIISEEYDNEKKR